MALRWIWDIRGTLVTWWGQMCSSTDMWTVLWFQNVLLLLKSSTTMQRTCSRTLWFPRRIVDRAPLRSKWQEWWARCLIRSRTCTVCDTKGWTEFFTAGCRYGPAAWVKGQLMNKTRKRGWPHLSFLFPPYTQPELVWTESTEDSEIQDLLREKKEVALSSNSLNLYVIWHITRRRPGALPPPFTFQRVPHQLQCSFFFKLLCTCPRRCSCFLIITEEHLTFTEISLIMDFLDSFLSNPTCSCTHICTTGSKNFVKT